MAAAHCWMGGSVQHLPIGRAGRQPAVLQCLLSCVPHATSSPSSAAAAHTPQDAHALNDRQKRRRTPLQGRTRPSVTSLTFLQGTSNQLATGGGSNGGLEAQLHVHRCLMVEQPFGGLVQALPT